MLEQVRAVAVQVGALFSRKLTDTLDDPSLDRGTQVASSAHARIATLPGLDHETGMDRSDRKGTRDSHTDEARLGASLSRLPHWNSKAVPWRKLRGRGA
jgi:hypothetical protein